MTAAQSEPPGLSPRSSRPSWAIILVFASAGGALLIAGRSLYPNLHIILDTGMCVLSGVLAAILWEMGRRLGEPFPRWLAASFAATALLEMVHVSVTVEWSAPLASIAASGAALRPTTWPLAAHVLPVGVGAALWLRRRGSQHTWGLTLFVLAFGAALFLLFRWLPPYAPPNWIGITRPTLELVPLLWAGVAVASWRRRSDDRTMPALARLATILFLAHGTMLFSQSPHDAPSMVAHLGKNCGYLVFLLGLVQIAASDMRERARGDAALREAHTQMEARIAARTTELAQVNDNLRTSEARQAGIVNSAMDAIISVDADQNIVLFNTAAEKMFRRPAAAAMGTPIARFIPQRFQERHRRHVAGFGETGVTSRSMRALGALSGVRSDGEEFPIEASISQIEIDGHKIFTVILRDITERMRAEAGAAQLVAIVESSEDAIVSKDLAGIVTSWNAGAEKLFGYPAGEMVGQPVLRLIPADRQEEETMIMARIQKGLSVRSFDTTRIRQDGVRIDVSVTVSAIRDRDGVIIGASKTARDITDRKRAEAELREKERQLHESDRRLAEIVHGMTEACFALDTQWRFTFVNDRGEALLRHRREDMLGRRIWEVFDKLVGTPMESHYRRAMREWIPVAFEAFSPIADRWLDIRLFPTAEGLAAFLLDISERKQAEQILRQTNEQLELKVTERTAEFQSAKERAESADRLKSEFLATMSHELRTPLNGIIGFTELLSDEKPGPLNAKQKQFAGEVLASGRHLLQLINEVLDLSKVAAGRMDVNLEAFSLAEAIEEVCASIAPLAEKKRIALRRDTAEAPPLVRLDRKMTKQILLNLISNALKFTPDGGVVRVVVSEAAPSELRIAVKDTGIGIRAEDFGKLFIEFQQISSSESRRQQGTGLGLALTRKLVELQGGSITVESVVGQGSTFTVVFPAAPIGSTA